MACLESITIAIHCLHMSENIKFTWPSFLGHSFSFHPFLDSLFIKRFRRFRLFHRFFINYFLIPFILFLWQEDSNIGESSWFMTYKMTYSTNYTSSDVGKHNELFKAVLRLEEQSNVVSVLNLMTVWKHFSPNFVWTSPKCDPDAIIQQVKRASLDQQCLKITQKGHFALKNKLKTDLQKNP